MNHPRTVVSFSFNLFSFWCGSFWIFCLLALFFLSFCLFLYLFLFNLFLIPSLVLKNLALIWTLSISGSKKFLQSRIWHRLGRLRFLVSCSTKKFFQSKILHEFDGSGLSVSSSSFFWQVSRSNLLVGVVRKHESWPKYICHHSAWSLYLALLCKHHENWGASFFITYLLMSLQRPVVKTSLKVGPKGLLGAGPHLPADVLILDCLISSGLLAINLLNVWKTLSLGFWICSWRLAQMVLAVFRFKSVRRWINFFPSSLDWPWRFPDCQAWALPLSTLANSWPLLFSSQLGMLAALTTLSMSPSHLQHKTAVDLWISKYIHDCWGRRQSLWGLASAQFLSLGSIAESIIGFLFKLASVSL